MRFDDPLPERLEGLRAETVNARRRGREFELIVGELFDRAGFNVHKNPGAARPRQTDLYATRGSEEYLIECKWQKAAMGTPEVRALLDRLRSQPAGVVGVLVSMGPISDAANEAVEAERNRPVVLLNEADLKAILIDRRDLTRLLRERRRQLAIHGRHGEAPRSYVSSERDKTIDPSLVDAEGAQQPWIESHGDFRRLVWSTEERDIDWVAGEGYGVTLDLRVPTADIEDLGDICRRLVEINCLTHAAAWSLRQSSRSWAGLGRDSLLYTLANRSARYESLAQTHHTEELVVVDECPGGWYTFTARIDASLGSADWARISMQLPGVPLDNALIERLRDRLEIAEPAFFRPRSSRSVKRFFLEQPITVQPLAFVVEHEPKGRSHTEWVRGIVFANPLASTSGVPRVMREEEKIVAALRSWHPPVGAPRPYVLEHLSWAESADATVAYAVADWQSKAREASSASRSGNERRPGKDVAPRRGRSREILARWKDPCTDSVAPTTASPM